MTAGTTIAPGAVRPIAEPAIASPERSQPPAAPAPGIVDALFTRMRTDPWFFPKLFVLALVAGPAAYAIAFAVGAEPFGVAIAVIPDMLAAIVCVWAILTAVLFLDAEEAHS